MVVTSMHRICTGRKRLAAPTAVRSVASRLPIHDVGCDCQNGLRVESAAIRGVLSQFPHKCADQPSSQLINAVVVVAELWEVACGFVVSHEPGLVPDHANFGVSNC